MTNKVRVPLHGQLQRSVDMEPGATVGATVGKNLFYPDGTLVELSDFGGTTPAPGQQVVVWSLIVSVPPNVKALAATSTTGLYTITGPGTSATRTIEGDGNTIEVTRGDGVAGNPVIAWLSPYVNYLTDELGNQLTDELGNKLTDGTGSPISPDFLPNHNALNGLQGGAPGEYYHLTLAQLTAIIAAVTAGTTGQFRRGDNTWSNQLLGQFGLGGMSIGGAVGIAMFIANVTTPPSTNPVGGGILYVEGGALKYRGSSGTITTIGPS